MSNQTLFIDRGTDFSFDMQLLNDDGSVLNVSNYVFTGVVRQNPYSNNPSANLIVNVFDIANGNVMISLDAANTSNLDLGNYIYSITANTGNSVILLFSGNLVMGENAEIAQ